MLQDQDFGSDSSDDDDYVPTNEGRESGNDISSGAEEVDSDLEDDTVVVPASQSKKKKSSAKPKSNRKVNPLLAQLQQNNVDDETKDENVVFVEGEEKNNKKEEDVWADFLADTKEKKEEPVPKPKKKSWSALLGNAKPKSVPVSHTPISSATANTSSSSSSSAASSSTLPSGTVAPRIALPVKKPLETPATVKITKIFEFAGEEVRVEEEVAADSTEAAIAAAQKSSAAASGVGVPVKRSSGLAGLVSSLGEKKQKLSTLEKTKLDWKSYKQQEGIEDELVLHTKSKDTYIDKQEFLQRADVRQFEHEREVRLGSRRANR